MIPFLILLIAILDVWAIVDLLSLKRGSDTEKKFLWITVILLLPFAGLVLYIFIGGRR